MLREPRTKTNQRLKSAALLSLLPFFLFLLLTSSPATRAPSVRDHSDADHKTHEGIENTVIVPAYHEAGNIPTLVRRVFSAIEKELADAGRTEVIVVDDDSRDGTVEAVGMLKEEGYRNVVLLVRTEEDWKSGNDEKGLSSAVLRGFKEARGENFVVMDADLQHPPEYVPAFFKALESHASFVMGTRYGPGGAVDKDWPFFRRLMSGVARSLARPLTDTSDPMSGFFGLTRELYMQSSPVNPTGFKIALELLLKTGVPSSHVREVPYAFAKRTVGASKLSSKTVVKYVIHLGTLYRWRMGFFGIILLEGLLVAGCWVALYAVDVGGVAWRKWRRQELRRREKGRLDV
ncbi:Dolichol-phosphate mannosyltransferase subunit 1 [Mycena indigotica]|uniref:Dolichol-phosphate mannosyltransferase subunit 1 n=1 Tax=Mycena indigotica TaxID=2126181 RepID=A0A8H6VSW7_9AGAR|nr:Dolichol-phosphate mannosyltransferase subunit 1 [Mycena indigotica]KAF7292694.1 Dolichol-phosphate mannosyltransferase subunit 1 [Mycena indigotica]